jgi:2-oxoglutarate ferredoxin oxidoreductase subunit alpha
VGGLEKDAASGNISYDPENHAAMVALRAEKIARLARPDDGALLREGPESGELLAISWGSTFGSVRQATRNLRTKGAAVAHLHLRRLWPLPPELAEILPRFRRILCAELNSGQLSTLLRATYLLPVEPCCQVNGRPFLVSSLEAAFGENLNGVAG